MSDPDNKRSSMEQPAAWWDAVDEMAAKAGVERSTWLYNVAIEKMPKRLAAKIPYRPKRGRPKLKLPEN